MRYLMICTLAGAALLPRSPASAVTVGAEYAQTNTCGWATIPNTKPDAEGFVNMMQAFGHTKRYLYGNGSFWPEDAVDCTVPGGLDCYYGDRPNVVFYSTHGGSSATRFRMAAGATHTVDGISTCTSDTNNPVTGRQWWKLGDNSARILCLSTCQGLQLTDLSHWDSVAKGLHMICGFDGSESDSPSVGGSFALWGNLGLTVKQAWFNARPSGNKAVVMAYGTSQADAINRREGERFSSSMAAIPPHSWRAWAWIQ
ncbi:MAG TPA: DUF6345 domain-containing protein [Armatimonadota bacterium]|jgi:hypothetical protein